MPPRDSEKPVKTNDRRSLVEGLSATPPSIEPSVEKDFVFGEKKEPASATVTAVIARVPISTRIREDFAKALKRASLERQLEGVEPHTLQDILEDALEPWLKANGYRG